MARFAHKDDFFDLGRLQDIVKFGQICIVGFVATANNDNEVAIWKSINSDTGGAGVSREVVIVVFDMMEFTEEFETVGKPMKTAKAGDN